jgi:hypothetical protein
MEGIVDGIKVVQGADKVPLPQQDGKPKKRHLKLTFQPMVGGIRKTVYKHGVDGLEAMFQKLCDVVPEGYAIRFDIKIMPMVQDSYLKGFMGVLGERPSESKFNVNQKIGNQMAEMSESNKEDKVQGSPVDGGSKI